MGTGRITRRRWRRADDALELEAGLACAVPTLIWFGGEPPGWLHQATLWTQDADFAGLQGVRYRSRKN